MQWSKAKRRVEMLFAPGLAGRVELRVTGYRAAHDAERRGWITIDGEEAWSFCTLRYYVERNELENGIRSANTGLLPFSIGVLAKRRLRSLVFRTDEHELVRALYRFRCSSEGIACEPSGGRIGERSE
jgi:hypothetical protein